MKPSSWVVAWVGPKPLKNQAQQGDIAVVRVEPGIPAESQSNQKKDEDWRRRRRQGMPRDGIAQGLVVQAVLAAEAAWVQWEAAASMSGSLHMNLEWLQSLAELRGDGS